MSPGRPRPPYHSHTHMPVHTKHMRMYTYTASCHMTPADSHWVHTIQYQLISSSMHTITTPVTAAPATLARQTWLLQMAWNKQKQPTSHVSNNCATFAHYSNKFNYKTSMQMLSYYTTKNWEDVTWANLLVFNVQIPMHYFQSVMQDRTCEL